MVSIIIPVYNERRTIASIVAKIKRVIAANEAPQVYTRGVSGNFGGAKSAEAPPKGGAKADKIESEIIVVDDGSTDGSAAAIASLENIIFLRHPYNIGYGASIKRGIKAARGEIICLIDGDGQHDPADLPRLLKEMADYDMVVGARQNHVIDRAVFRRTGRAILTGLAYFLTGRKIPDLNSGFRAFRKELALKYLHILPTRFSLTTTITLCALTNEYTVKYIPIKYRPPQSKSSIRPVRDFANFLALIFRMVIYFRPFRVFMVPSVIIFAIGLGFLIEGLIAEHNVADTAVMMITSGLVLGSIGLLADLIVKTRQSE